MEGVFGSIITYLGQVILTSVVQLLILIGPILLLGFCMHLVAGSLDRLATRAIGWKVYYAIFSFLGTIVHELGHAFFHVIFGHKITNMKLTNRDPLKGETAHVAFAYNPRNVFQRIGVFFSAIGPILFGALLTYLLALLLLGADVFSPLKALTNINLSVSSLSEIQAFFSATVKASIQTIGSIFSTENLRNWRLWLFLYLAFSIGANSSLSPADLKGAATGFMSLVVIVLIVNLVTLWVGDYVTRAIQFLGQFNGILGAVIMVAIILSIFAYLILLVIFAIKKLIRR